MNEIYFSTERGLRNRKNVASRLSPDLPNPPVGICCQRSRPDARGGLSRFDINTGRVETRPWVGPFLIETGVANGEIRGEEYFLIKNGNRYQMRSIRQLRKEAIL
jgi:hypothetical protein